MKKRKYRLINCYRIIDWQRDKIVEEFGFPVSRELLIKKSIEAYIIFINENMQDTTKHKIENYINKLEDWYFRE